jgi:hypothetical protein
LNQRPLRYECETAMTGNPLILREKRWTTISFTFSVATSLLLVLRPVLGWYGSKMGARKWLPLTRSDDIERALFCTRNRRGTVAWNRRGIEVPRRFEAAGLAFPTWIFVGLGGTSLDLEWSVLSLPVGWPIPSRLPTAADAWAGWRASLSFRPLSMGRVLIRLPALSSAKRSSSMSGDMAGHEGLLSRGPRDGEGDARCHITLTAYEESAAIMPTSLWVEYRRQLLATLAP